jgi:RNA polymerase primary sigma factor
MEAALKPEALERFARITDLFKKFEKLQAERVDTLAAATTSRRQGKEVREAARGADRRGRKRAVPRDQDRIPGRQPLCLQPPPDHAGRADAAPGRTPQGQARRLPRRLYVGNELDEAWLAANGQEGQEVGRLRREGSRRVERIRAEIADIAAPPA